MPNGLPGIFCTSLSDRGLVQGACDVGESHTGSITGNRDNPGVVFRSISFRHPLSIPYQLVRLAWSFGKSSRCLLYPDSWIGFHANDPAKTIGPLVFAVTNGILVYWLLKERRQGDPGQATAEQ
jgi:hypothetical protein